MSTLPALPLALLLLSGAGDDAWTPYDRFSQPDDSCDVNAVVPGPGGSVLLGTTCNRLDGAPIGPVVAVDLTGKALATPFAKALATSVPDDRMRELSQLIAHGDGYVVTQSSRAKSKLRVESVHYPAGLSLTRLTAAGTRDAPFTAAVQAALDERLAKSWGLLDVSADAKGQLIVAAAQPPADERPYLKDAPVRIVRFDGQGAVTAEVKLDEVLKSMGLGYFHVLMVRPRPDGGLFVGGRFQKPNNPHDRLYLLAFDAAWKPDAKFNGPFLKKFGKGNDLEIRLIVPDAQGGLFAVGQYKEAHVVHLTAAGAVDAAFKPFTLPGQYPQGRFMKPAVVALGAGGALWLSFYALPGQSPPWSAPGLVKLDAKGTPDAALAKALGTGFWDEPSKKDSELHGWMSAVTPLPDGSVIIAGHFDHFGDAAVRPPMRLKPDGTRDTAFAPKLSTEVAKPKTEPNATTSAYFKADGKDHYVACKQAERTTTLIYSMQSDPWGHQPSCIVTYDGHMGTPGGAWQDCDKRVKKLSAEGAKCEETKENPMSSGHFR